MRWFILTMSFIFVLPPSLASAQCADGTPEGGSPADNLCQICRNSVLEALPPRTACGSERRVQCDSVGAFRRECVLVEASETETECKDSYRWTECPNGLACDEGICLRVCVSLDQCRQGFVCEQARCVASNSPDMGGGHTDMGDADMNEGDVGIASHDMGTTSEDSGTDHVDDIGADAGSTLAPRDGGCCGVVNGPSNASWGLLLLVVALLRWRRRG